MTSADDEIHILKEGWRLLGHHVQAELLARGWQVTNLDVADDAPLEFFWPPTAPVGYGDHTEAAPRRPPEMSSSRPNPWTRPTTITHVGSGWLVEYGAAIAQAPDAPIEHTDDDALLADLPRIEWWPMSVDEAGRLEHERVLRTTYADAYDQHSLGYGIMTEPYLSRLREVCDRIYSNPAVMTDDPQPWRWAGDLRARARIIDGEMWASAVRTARAGGDDSNP
ncbi:hypothetical protein [Microbacterium sp.]|uniref:hypothetical protein n=1 Tax=Microbacterium sp. TaxID=51671 RepID=UPI0039E4EEC8